MSPSITEATLRRDARTILDAALDAVDPALLVAEALTEQRLATTGGGEIFVIGFGKAAAAMARGVDRVLGARVASGVVVLPHGSDPGLPPHYRVCMAGHPSADKGSVAAARSVRDLARSAGPADLIVALISGGGSALLTLPPPGVSPADIAAVIDALSRSGAPIENLNTVRKHLDLMKGGRLALEAAPARTLALILSDVPGDGPDVVASGPLAPDRTTFADALTIVRGCGDLAPRAVLRRLARGARGEVDESPARDHPCFDRVTSLIIGSGATAVAAACRAASGLGYAAEAIPTAVTGDVRDVLATLSTWVRQRSGQRPACRVSAGEPTVRVLGAGKGGRNQHLALEAALAIDGLRSVLVASLATDGVDGPTTAAGALVTGTTARRASTAGFDVRARLLASDSHPVLAALGDLILTGPTGTNVADIQLALVG